MSRQISEKESKGLPQSAIQVGVESFSDLLCYCASHHIIDVPDPALPLSSSLKIWRSSPSKCLFHASMTRSSVSSSYLQAVAKTPKGPLLSVRYNKSIVADG